MLERMASSWGDGDGGAAFTIGLGEDDEARTALTRGQFEL